MTHSRNSQAFGSEAQARRGHPEYSRGMTYVELIVVLSIFGIMSTVAIYNYGAFQAKVDVKNTASDIALKIVEAQKSAMSGNLPSDSPSGWKSSYGVYFDPSTDEDLTDNIFLNKKLIYFKDLNDIINSYSLTKSSTIFMNWHLIKNTLVFKVY